MEELNQYLNKKIHEEVEVTECLPIYRDLIVFRKNKKIVGFAKICLECHKILMRGTTLSYDNFGQSGEYHQLKRILKKRIKCDKSLFLSKKPVLHLCQTLRNVKKITLKQVVSILMSIIILLPIFMKIGVIVDFKIHQDFIEDTYCVNKDITTLVCKGKCYLKDQLKTFDESQQDNFPLNQKSNTIEINYFFHQNELSQVTSLLKHSFNISWRSLFHDSSHLTKIFPPSKDFILKNYWFNFLFFFCKNIAFKTWTKNYK